MELVSWLALLILSVSFVKESIRVHKQSKIWKAEELCVNERIKEQDNEYTDWVKQHGEPENPYATENE